MGEWVQFSPRVQRMTRSSIPVFLSHKLSHTECNYDVGDIELLEVKLALEEWLHWLEGTKEPLLVWTDHKNLEYIRSAKCLNPRQAR